MRVSSENVPEVTRILTYLREATRQEAGNIFYQFFSAEDRPGVFTTIEHWEDANAEAAHWQEEHLKRAVAQLGPLMAGDMLEARYVRGDGQ